MTDHVARIVVTVVLALGTVLTAAVPAAAADRCDLPASSRDHHVRAGDGTRIVYTLHRPADACSLHPVPVILHSHGFGGTRARDLSSEPTLQRLAAAGYAIASVDARGHGESGGWAWFHHLDAGAADFSAVLDDLHGSGWILREPRSGHARDIAVGTYGGSYAGALQLNLAAVDRRIDAVVPMVTYHDLESGLAPAGAVNTAWVRFMLGRVGRGVAVRPALVRWLSEAAETGRLPEPGRRWMSSAGPARHLRSVRAPTLLIQGMTDDLFAVDQAAATWRELTRHGTDAWLLGINHGHPGPYSRSFATVSCGGPVDASIRTFLDAHVRGLRGPAERVERWAPITLTAEQGTCIEIETWPPPAAEVMSRHVLARSSGGTLTLSTAPVDATIAGPVTITAQPLEGRGARLSARLVVTAADGRQRVVHGQRTEMLVPEEGPLRLRLRSVATHLAAGERLDVVVDSDRSVTLADATVIVPTVR